MQVLSIFLFILYSGEYLIFLWLCQLPLYLCPQTRWGEVIECTTSIYWGENWCVDAIEKKRKMKWKKQKIRCIRIFHFQVCVYGSAGINNPTVEAMWTNPPYLPLLTTIWTLLILESNSFQTDRQTNGHKKVSISQTILYGNNVLKASHLSITI